jgi:uracil-DNA glycosylase family 4
VNKKNKLLNLKNKIFKLGKKFPGKNLVFSDGNINAKVMIIGEAPGKTEDKLQKPFVGRSGKLLDDLLKKVQLDRTKVYITNVVNYRPDKNRKPTTSEINYFKKTLFIHIKIINPKFILLLGSTAANVLLGHATPLNDLRGQWKFIKVLNTNFNILITYHPAFLLRQPTKKIFMIKDLIKLKKKLNVST